MCVLRSLYVFCAAHTYTAASETVVLCNQCAGGEPHVRVSARHCTEEEPGGRICMYFMKKIVTKFVIAVLMLLTVSLCLWSFNYRSRGLRQKA